jgi:hypothetical protein
MSIGLTMLPRREESLVLRAVRHEGHDRDQREGRLKPARVQRCPRECPGAEHVRPEAESAVV